MIFKRRGTGPFFNMEPNVQKAQDGSGLIFAFYFKHSKFGHLSFWGGGGRGRGSDAACTGQSQKVRVVLHDSQQAAGALPLPSGWLSVTSGQGIGWPLSAVLV